MMIFISMNLMRFPHPSMWRNCLPPLYLHFFQVRKPVLFKKLPPYHYSKNSEFYKNHYNQNHLVGHHPVNERQKIISTCAMCSKKVHSSNKELLIACYEIVSN